METEGEQSPADSDFANQTIAAEQHRAALPEEPVGQDIPGNRPAINSEDPIAIAPSRLVSGTVDHHIAELIRALLSSPRENTRSGGKPQNLTSW